MPTTRTEQRRYLAKTVALAQRCGARNGELLAHITTADTARDLDHLRRLVGDRQLSYLGESYGTLIGQTYANLFPRRVRAMVLDGVVDPVAAAAGTEAVLASSLADTDRVFREFLRSALWPEVAAVLELAAEGDASVLDAIAAGATSDQARVLLQEQGVALVCADSPARHPATAWPGVVRRLAAVSRIGGPPLGWINAPCASWPTSSADRYTGPWNATTKHPILVIGTRFDPNTPLANARRAARRLGNAVLLTHDGYGHLSRRDPSTCVVQAPAATSWISPRQRPEPCAPLTASRSIPSSANHALDRVFIAATGCSPPVFILLARWSRKSPGQGDACLVTWL